MIGIAIIVQLRVVNSVSEVTCRPHDLSIVRA